MATLWVASYVMLWVCVIVLAVAVIILLREVGVLHARLHPLGAHFAGEGPPLDTDAPMAERFGYSGSDWTVLAFTSPTCEICAHLRPSLDALDRQYREVVVHLLDLSDATRADFVAFNVASTPYAVVVGRNGLVRGRGIINSLEQLEELLADSRVRADVP